MTFFTFPVFWHPVPQIHRSLQLPYARAVSDLTRVIHTNLIKESLNVSAWQIKEQEGKHEKTQAKHSTSEIKKIYLPSVNLFSFPPLNDFMQTAPREHGAATTKASVCASTDRDEDITYVVPSFSYLPAPLSSLTHLSLK